MTDTVPVTDADAVIAALRSSHHRLRSLVEPLDVEQLEARSYASEWSVAQVLSHLGSGAEIFDLIVGAGLRGEDPPGREASAPIWDTWNAKGPQAQAADALVADGALVQRLESLDDEQRQRFGVHLFGRDADLAAFARMRLAEHAIHTWDIAVVLDPTATVAADAVEALVDTFSPIAGYTGKPVGRPWKVRIDTSEPARQFVLDAGDAVALLPGGGDEALPAVRMPAESFYRLVYGRLDPDHTPPLDTTDVDLDELRAIFPGF